MSGNFTWKPSPLSSTIIFWLARESACFSLKCPPALYFTVLLNEKADLSIAMYVTLTDIQNGEPVSVPGTACGGLEVALCELTYYHRWLNISAELRNNILRDLHTVLDIPDGYYNICELDKEVFRPLGAELSLHAPTGRLRLSAEKRLLLNRWLADLLGFYRERFDPGWSHIAVNPHRLITHREICVHLAEVSTSENLHNGRPSTLLKSIPVENERCRGGRTESFPVLQYKRLASGPLSQLTLTILDTSGRKLDFDYLSAVLHIRRNG